MGNLVYLLKRDDLAGLAVRVMVLAVVMLLSLGTGLLLAGLSESHDRCWMAFLFVLPGMVAGLLAAEFPRGPEFALLRLGGSMFARTGLLMFFLLVARKGDLLNEVFIYYILAFYSIGLLADVTLTGLKSWQGTSSSHPPDVRSSELAAN